MRSGRADVVGVLAVAAVAFGAVVAEGAVVRAYGGVAIAAMAIASVLATRGRVEVPDRPAMLGAGLLALLVAMQALPWPRALRAVVGPGMSAWLDRVGTVPEDDAGRDAWLSALATADLEAAVGSPAPPASFDMLAGATDVGWRTYAARPDQLAWIVALFGAVGLAYAAGRALAREERALRALCVSLVLFGVAEALFGIANRSGGSTGLAAKQFYLGSATGTLINRGHFAAVLCLSIGACWGLAAQLFPLVPEEVRRHRARVTRSSQPPSVLEVSGDRIPRLALLTFAGAVLAVGLVAANSRGPLLGFAAAGAVAAAVAWRRRGEPWHAGIAVTVPVAGVALAALAFGPMGAVGRFRDALRGDDVSVVSRLSLWRESLAAFADAPLFGWGFGAWNTAWPLHERGPHVYVAMYAHSELVEWLVEGGIVAVTAGALLVAAWLRATWRGVVAAPPEEPRAALAIGLAAGVGAVALQSLADFPLRTPGVALAWGLCAGAVHGALRGACAEVAPAVGDGVRAFRAGAATIVAVAIGVAGLGGRAALADAGFEGSREARVGEVSRAWYVAEAANDEQTATAALADAERVAAAHSLDPWAHAAVARLRSIRARAAWERDGGTPEDEALAAEQALARVWLLRGTDPRLAVVTADTLLRLGRGSPTPDAYRARAVERLAYAVSVDAWRAQDAFGVGASLPVDALAAIAAASDGTAPTARARVRFEHARALERLKLRDAALAEHRAAAALDPSFGPPYFAAGVILRAMGDTAAANAAFRALLSARERPLGMEGWAALFLDRLDLAEARLRAAEALDPRNRWAIEGLVALARRRDDVPAELAALRRIAVLAPDDTAARDRIRVLEAGRR